ncbi:unnamed protein product [Oppiella nova]|uniref:ABC transporter domain-containing protein n=1 Tax=Oppiella nova TaxID=334625 RepID=A0A7R9M512_9ACAR|nr:unnamed protein product [Oppiella nova]CAG2169599.1 unnamed protein product [Oppiella nova]
MTNRSGLWTRLLHQRLRCWCRGFGGRVSGLFGGGIQKWTGSCGVTPNQVKQLLNPIPDHIKYTVNWRAIGLVDKTREPNRHDLRAVPGPRVGPHYRLEHHKPDTVLHLDAIRGPYALYYTPNTSFTWDLMNTLKTISGWTVTAMRDPEELREFMSKTTNNSGNTRLVKTVNDIPIKTENQTVLINEAFLTKVAKDYGVNHKKTKEIEFWMFPGFKDSDTRPFNRMSRGDLISVSIVFGYIVLCPLIVRRVTNEKSIKVKELMRMMGMSDWVFWSSHFINYLIVMSVHTFIFTMLWCYGFPAIGVGDGRALFHLINAILFFIIVLIFCIQTILFCMAFSTLFNGPVVSVIVMVVVYTLIYGVGMFYLHPFFTLKEDDAYTLRLISSVYPTYGLTWTMALIGRWEWFGVGVGFKELFSKVPYIGLGLGEVLVVQILSCLLWAFVIWYLDAVWPFQYGVPQPVYFPYQPSYYWPQKSRSVKDVESTANSDANPNNESQPKDSKVMISLRKISKDFGGGRGVKDMSLDIFSQQITVLLGHNGAGKTTTMNMITGIFPPTSGTVLVNGYDVMTATREARKSIGLCPQENILFNDLSVEQHLRLYAVLKDCPKNQLNAEIDRVLSVIRLIDKKFWRSILLSGGMKRRLSLGIAIIGATKVLILDEPTSGLDPEARRGIWDVLEEFRQKKTILLTTHYMEEADVMPIVVLGDRIAIMSEGVLKCCGSAMFLKKRFGAGYHLRILKSDNYKKEAVDEILKRHLPDSRLQSEINTEVIYSLESEDTSKQTDKNVFPKLFDELESRKQEIGIQSFGITVITMEDVFLKVGSDGEVDHKSKNTKNTETKTTNYTNLIGFKLILQSVYGLLAKRFHSGRRHWSTVSFQIIIPALLFILILYSDETLWKDIWILQTNDTNSEDFGLKYYIPNARRHGMSAALLKTESPNEWLITKSKSFEEYVMKYTMGASANEASGSFLLQLWYSLESTHSLPLSINLMYESLVQYFISQMRNDFTITTTNEIPKPKNEFTEEPGSNIASAIVTCVLLMPIALPFLGASYVVYPIQEMVSKSKLLQLMTGLSSFTYWLSNYLFDLLNHLLAIVLLMLIIYICDINYIFFYDSEAVFALFLLLFTFGLPCDEISTLSIDGMGVGRELICLAASALIFLILLFIIEDLCRCLKRRAYDPNLTLVMPKDETVDSDVMAERQRVDELMKNKELRAQEGIVVVNLNKSFGTFTAVKNLSFGVHKNESFGLLGVNGAGKTTTFSMLTGEELPDDGNAYIESIDLMANNKLFESRIGYCPQFDALLDRLTGEEMLYLFARLRGIPSDVVANEVTAVIHAIDLQNHCKHLTHNYSGGNKRMLSLGLSITGRPALVFLNEPTAGVDPVARRKMWQTLEKLKSSKNSSIILTSHSMDESEALCTRIAIMVRGSFRCLGSTQQLKSKFGQGFTFIIKLKLQLVANEYTNRVDAYVKQHIPSAVLRDSHECHLHYHITDTSTQWSQLFHVMQSAHKELDLEDYNLSDTTLEQIFLSFAKQK